MIIVRFKDGASVFLANEEDVERYAGRSDVQEILFKKDEEVQIETRITNAKMRISHLPKFRMMKSF